MLRRAAATLFALALLVGAGCTPPLRNIPGAPTADPGFVGERTVTRPGVDEPADPPTDMLYPGDVIAVRMVGMPQQGAPIEFPSVAVDRTGRVHLPLVGDVQVGGRSLDTAERAIQAELAKFDRFTRVSLVLTDARGRHATVSGAVEKPGIVPLAGDPRLADVLGAAGGPRAIPALSDLRIVPLADIAGARLVRNGTVLPLDFRLALEGHPRHNVRVYPNDLIFVPPSVGARVVVMGNVRTPRTIPHYQGYRLLSALADAGGLTADADSEDIRVIRGGYEQPRVFRANARDVLAARSPNPELAPGDIIYVTDHWTAPITQVLDRLVPAMSAFLLARSVSKE